MKTNFLKKSALTVLTLTTASFYFSQEQEDSSKDIEAVVLVGGVADIAKSRKTPVAVSTIKENTIVEKLGNQEFPEILNSTPSVYSTKAGGGFGDAKINIRGFGNENIAVMINGMPVNDMENGRVYWSNWAGLSDVTSAMQVQRGLGASKLAIASVGGTINIVTRSADKKKGGNLTVGMANDGYHKSTFSYNTGKSVKGWSTSFLMGRTAGAMYADGTNFEGYNYYFALGYQPSKKHDFQFTITGAPQWHHQRGTAPTIQAYLDFGNGIDRPNRRYNADWGYLTGTDGIKREYSWRRNYFHKPITSLNWDWVISGKSKLSTVLYASFGRGGGTGIAGSGNLNRLDKITGGVTENGITDFDAVVAANLSSNPTAGQLVRRAGINSHNWYGILTNFQHKISENLNFSLGADARYYKGYHYQIVSDFLGASGYSDERNKNEGVRTITVADKSNPSWNFFKSIHDAKNQIAFSNDGEVLWYGTFGQLEYSNDNLSAFVQGSISNQGFQRIDHFIIDGVTTSKSGEIMNKNTGFKNILGYNVKGGLNYNINENHNVFGNVGYYERQPFFNAIYRGNENIASPHHTNEKIFGVELGYGFRSGGLNANLNLYRTDWNDVYQRISKTSADRIRYYMEVNGLHEIHQGLEVDASYKVSKVLNFNGMFSIGDWFYKGNATSETYADATGVAYILPGDTSNEQTLYLDKVKVGGAAQLTAALGLAIEPVSNIKFDANWRYVDNLYAALDVSSFSTEQSAKQGALRLPSYNLLDLGLSYKLYIKNGQSFTLRGNVYNVLDATYIAESISNIHAVEGSRTYKGIDMRNQVFFGYGRTWSASLTFHF